jgi:hypothetical protein
MADTEKPGCISCAHPRRSEIDAALMAGEPLRLVGERFGIAKSSLSRHARKHVTPNSGRPGRRVRRRRPRGKFVLPEAHFRTIDEYERYMTALNGLSAELVSESRGSENLRLRQILLRDAREAALAVARSKGWVRDEPAPTPSVNIFAGMSLDAVAALRDELRTLVPRPVKTIDHTAVPALTDGN